MAPLPDSQLPLWPGDAYDILARGGEPRYRVYPSLLDKFQQLLDYEQVAEEPWNKRDDEYVLTPDQMYDKLQQELIDAINREPRDPSEAADRGTALNEIVDCMIIGQPCRRPDMTVKSLKDAYGHPFAIRADFDGFTFDFDPDLCRALRDAFSGALVQVFTQAPIDTRFGSVLLYGYMDYWAGDRIIDLKTTPYYEFGKYERRWQRWVYPYCAIHSGLTDNVSQFVYHAVRLGKDKVITGSQFPEVYTYDHAACVPKLRAFVEAFIDWLESPAVRPRIKDKKIFNILEL